MDEKRSIFDDWIYRQSEDVAINRAYVSKFGVEIGSVTIVFLRGQAAPQLARLTLTNGYRSRRIFGEWHPIHPSAFVVFSGNYAPCRIFL